MRNRTLGRLATPTTAAIAGVVSLVFVLAAMPLEALVPGAASPSGSGVVAGTMWALFGLSFTGVGFVVARRQPGNVVGWLLLATAIAFEGGSDAPAYAYLDYTIHHGTLVLGHIAVLLSGAYLYGFLAMPLIILFFPDGQVTRAWRWPLRAYLALSAAVVVGSLVVGVQAWSLRFPVDASGNLVGLGATGGNGWFTPFFEGGFLACIALALAAVVYQARRYRRSRGERRQQLKWLGAGGLACVLLVVISVVGANSSFINNVFLPLGLVSLPLAIGVAMLRYRLYEIDRLISRTLSYALLTGLLVGLFIGFVALTTDTLDLSGRVGVAASTLVAAALFNPLRIRIQRLVDRRFNRAHYDAEATVAAFTARLRDAVEIDAIRTDLLDAVNRAVQPTHASVWIKP
jgi:hypothetical protein